MARSNATIVRDLFSRAVQSIQAGDPQSGLRLLIKADKLAPSNTSIEFNLGYTHHLIGNYSKAIKYYLRCVERDSSMVDGWRNLATAAREGGQSAVAIKALKKLVSMQPDDAGIANDLGNLLVTTGRLEEAVAIYRQAIQADPTTTIAAHNLCRVLLQMNLVDDAESTLRGILATHPDDHVARHDLSRLLDSKGWLDEALEVINSAPGGLESIDDWLIAGNLHVRRGDASMAEACLLKVLEQDPDHAVALNNLGLVHAIRSDRDGAEALFRRALECGEHYTEPWRNLVALIRYKDIQDVDICAMKSLVDERELTDSARMHLGFALGKALDDCSQFTEAFKFYQCGNEIRKREVPFDIEALSLHAQRIIATVDRTFFVSRTDFGCDSELPVFIVGMPRTGTTLIEQMLSAHPNFTGAGELMLINRTIQQLEFAGADNLKSAYPECLLDLDRDATREMAVGYVEALERYGTDASVSRISDKMPYNFFHLGLVRLLFPKARIIHCLRHPLDTCLSAYFNYFPGGLDFTYSQQDLVDFYAIYRKLMEHWREVAGIEFIDVRYEDLVADPKAQLGEVLAYLNLEWNADVLNFHKDKSSVRTLSAWQVRQPIHRSSDGRYHDYEQHLGPLIDGLTEYVKEYNDKR